MSYASEPSCHHDCQRYAEDHHRQAYSCEEERARVEEKVEEYKDDGETAVLDVKAYQIFIDWVNQDVRGDQDLDFLVKYVFLYCFLKLLEEFSDFLMLLFEVVAIQGLEGVLYIVLIDEVQGTSKLYVWFQMSNSKLIHLLRLFGEQPPPIPQSTWVHLRRLEESVKLVDDLILAHGVNVIDGLWTIELEHIKGALERSGITGSRAIRIRNAKVTVAGKLLYFIL